ncbi:co-chaperone GroES [Mycoplasmoides gallisepticum]|uniref:10 kDa chaperonin n=1 Tax=Mycoplasmoides gallisepticum TaxID=2096 RepID=A0AB36DTK6_MYCGL|nr:co-chaperone GroES [Mycoplasmoides gallisepticum]OBU78878.1 co-chaperone GroES [Mycoplasmoides gallisepticum]OBU79226.1 co-chaperone GroES [Mycoplasmoides gallisepticum]OBU79689.1 co-chaperone GroES [Mycoplasmoides gallisepticum]OBU80021.1 co-chaperone GroES [Mycoplasmoides gallisepticum]OBU81030.1 co-chaperone GroES [Mycoplasmoides gallisepticum]
MNIKPLHDNVLVEVLAEAKTSKLGIITTVQNPDKATSTKGLVIALGDGMIYAKQQKVDYQIKVNDHVYFKEYSGTEIVVNDKTYKILSYEEIIGVIR